MARGWIEMCVWLQCHSIANYEGCHTSSENVRKWFDTKYSSHDIMYKINAFILNVMLISAEGI